MSDLYLDLRHRIPVVAEWTNVGTQEMEDAQDRTGLSDEKLARQIPISAKTWTRWKRRGQVPTHLLPKVAPLLGFEIIPLEPVPLHVQQNGPTQVETVIMVPPALRESLAVLVELVSRLGEIAERSEATLGRIEQAMLAPATKPQRASRTRSRAP